MSMLDKQDKTDREKLIIQMFINSPEPSEENIKHQQQKDRNNNPHNEPYHNKPRIRGRDEIIADLKMVSVLSQLKRFNDIYSYLDNGHFDDLNIKFTFENLRFVK